MERRCMIKQGNFLGKVVNVTKDDAGEIVSVQLRAAVVGVRDTAPAAFGRWPASRSCGPCQAARSSRERPAAHSKRTGQAIGANRMRPPVGIDREPGCRRDERRLNAQDRTFGGKMPGKALVRRAIDCRFLFALSSCQLDMWRTLVASSVPPNL